MTKSEGVARVQEFRLELERAGYLLMRIWTISGAWQHFAELSKPDVSDCALSHRFARGSADQLRDHIGAIICLLESGEIESNPAWIDASKIHHAKADKTLQRFIKGAVAKASNKSPQSDRTHHRTSRTRRRSKQ